MSKFIEFIKRIFFKKTLLLKEAETLKDEEKYQNQKENFLNSIKSEKDEDNILLIQIKLENGLIDESKLNDEQLLKIKNLYYNQILDLISSIKNYKLKLN